MMWKLDHAIIERIRQRLRRLYPADQVDPCLARIESLLQDYGPRLASGTRQSWDQTDVVLITYADQFRQEHQRPLQSLHEFLTTHGLDRLISTLHVLPFYPSSSDGGFSVVDYRAVDPVLGSWEDIAQLGGACDLMFDLVLNHTSAHSHWFQQFLQGNPDYRQYFITVDPRTDLSMVTRPRSLPLLTPVDTSTGKQYVWTTFSADQVDLNFAHPAVLLEMLDILLVYIHHGARIIRLDAVAYLWKTVGTSCIHLWQTHEVVKLFRDVLDAVTPHAVLLTETNVPFQENISYFGAGDEAHMVYQFSLPPLILDALLSQDARPLMTWLAGLPAPKPGTTYFNFTASHDGIGLRPLEGILPADRIQRLVEALRARGGLVSTYRDTNGVDKPYEANITLTSALRAVDGQNDAWHVRRMMTSQGLMLALQGMPAIYVHSLFGTPNDTAAAARSGHARDINRSKFQRPLLAAELADANSMTARVFQAWQKMLTVRRQQTAFHPDAAQVVYPATPHWLVALRRTNVQTRQTILVLANVSCQPQQLNIRTLADDAVSGDLLSDQMVHHGKFSLAPYQLAWLI